MMTVPIGIVVNFHMAIVPFWIEVPQDTFGVFVLNEIRPVCHCTFLPNSQARWKVQFPENRYLVYYILHVDSTQNHRSHNQRQRSYREHLEAASEPSAFHRPAAHDPISWLLPRHCTEDVRSWWCCIVAAGLSDPRPHLFYFLHGAVQRHLICPQALN